MQTPRPAAVLATCCLSLFVVGVDNTIVTVALPTIRADLHTSLQGAQWIVDAYQVVLGALLVSAGALADRWGRRRVLQTGMSLFAVATLLCGLAPSAGWLVAARALQGLGGSMMNPVALAIVSHAYPDPGRRAKAFGVWSGVYGLSMAVGPVAGGLLVGAAGWRSVFWATVPLCVLGVVLCARVVPESRAPEPRRADPIGQALLVVGLGLLTFVVIEGAALGRHPVARTALIGASLACAAAFAWWEGRCPEPLVDPRLFRSLPFTGGVLVALLGMAAAGGYLWVMAFLLQAGHGLSPARAGVWLLPVALMVALAAPVSGRLAARHGPRLPLAISGAGLALGGLLLVGVHDRTPMTVLLASFLTFGVGFGMLNAPVTSIAVAGMPPARAGVAAAVASTGRQTGQAVGVAVVGALVVPRLTAGTGASLAAASHAAWWAVAAAGVAVAGIAVLATTHRALGTAARPTASGTAARPTPSPAATAPEGREGERVH